MERYIPISHTRPKPPRVWRAVLGTTILSNGKGYFGPTDQNDQTSQSGPPLKLVPNVPVGPNRTCPFHLMYQPKFPEFSFEWKVPLRIELWPSRKEGRALMDCVNPYFFPWTNSKEGTGNKVREFSISCHYTFTYLVQASSFRPAISAPRRACSQVITY